MIALKINRIAGLLAGACLLGSVVCSAAVPDEELLVGGIGYGTSASYLRNVYGEPDKIDTEHHHGKLVEEYKYGKSLEFKLADGSVYRIEVSGPNGFATRAGVAVGMAASVLRDKYGEPDLIRGDEHIYRSASDPNIGFVFEVENNRITEFECGLLEH